MGRYLKLYKIFFLQYMKGLMQSKIDFFIGFFSFFLNQILGVAFLYLVFEKIPDLNGWSFYQLIFIYGYAQIPRGIDHFVTDYLWLFARKTVKEGSFDRYLLRPVNPLFQVIVERCQPDGIGEILVGVLLVAYSAVKLDLAISVGGILLFFISIIAGAIIFTAVKLFFATNAFFMKDSYSLLYLVHNMSDFAKYPTSIYAKPIRIVLSYIIPFAFTAFIPASFFLQKGNLLQTIGMEVFVAALSFLIAYRYFAFGCNKYESAGN
ncbi:ABC transporter permease [Konateibacter massiliensis]|uniref:ABC transporter permease n=1 Tax=Konateibacter massiliensis TaxID=2002841 RepID=UPI000C1453F1|nr:ABC-2 family transporter protein [Konateibacter massiliensis]